MTIVKKTVREIEKEIAAELAALEAEGWAIDDFERQDIRDKHYKDNGYDRDPFYEDEDEDAEPYTARVPYMTAKLAEVGMSERDFF
ncbi:MAG: hypothetical protein E7576_07775 [Ruminococcaceae bacterium]|nr:hypothetical protein [Oscillospiraceae bacterium]